MAAKLPKDLNDLPPTEPDGELPHGGWAIVDFYSPDEPCTIFGRVREAHHFGKAYCRIDYQAVPDGRWLTKLVKGDDVELVTFLPEHEVREHVRTVIEDARRTRAKTEFESD